MESRKLIKFGNSSHVIVIPNSWLRKHSLKKGDLIYMRDDINNLVLSPDQKDRPNEEKEIVIDIDGLSKKMMDRKIVSYYIKNYNMFIIKGKKLKLWDKDILERLHSFVALEVIEHTKSSIVAKDFLNIKKIDIQKTIKQIDIVIRAMMVDTYAMFNDDIYENIYTRDNNVNRLTFLVYKCVNYFMENPSEKLTNKDLLKYWILVTRMEHLADLIKRIARSFKRIKLNKKDVEDLLKVYYRIEQHYLGTMKAFYENDSETAYTDGDLAKSIIKDANKFGDKNPNKRWVENTVEKLKQLTSEVHQIGRLAYD